MPITIKGITLPLRAERVAQANADAPQPPTYLRCECGVIRKDGEPHVCKRMQAQPRRNNDELA